MHRLRQHILHQLVRYPNRRYAEIKPVEVEGNLFMYHLNGLLKESWVAKRGDGAYELTSEGLAVAEHLSLETFKPRQQATIVTLIACRNAKGEWLFYQRHRQPLIDMVGFPYGKVHQGESVAEAAGRELLEKTGIRAKLQHRGDGYITIYQGSDVVSQVLFHFFYGRAPEGQIKAHKTGQAQWASMRDIAPNQLIPSVADLIRLNDENPGQLFFTELVYRL